MKKAAKAAYTLVSWEGPQLNEKVFQLREISFYGCRNFVTAHKRDTPTNIHIDVLVTVIRWKRFAVDDNEILQ